ncbi:zinc finger protein 541 [Bufo gargarizans]|uniref:zinc finger protein 541 n=1 Tax=Bufo gargarizans TaxID=30331 RepID=UPI001CF53B84|nr:zinc finger protein 541 [Bufo gargarizans]
MRFTTGLLIKQQKVPATKPSRAVETASIPPALSSSDLIRCLVTESLQQKVISNMVVLQDPKAILVPQMMTLNSSKTNEDVAPVNTYTLINSTSKLSMGPDYVWCSDPPPVSPSRSLPSKVQSMQKQLNSYSTGFFDVAAVNGSFIGAGAENLHSLDHRYVSPPADNGCETTGAQYLSTHDPDFTRLTLQPCDLLEFQVQNPAHIFLPMTNSQSHAASFPVMSMPQCVQETNSIRGWGDLQTDPQELPALSRIIRAPENVTSGSQNGSSTAQPGEESQKLSSSSRETWPKLSRSQRKSTTTKSECRLSLSSTVPASQVALDSFSATNKVQSNERLNRLFMSNQRDVQEEEMRSWQQKVEPTTLSIESETWTTMDTTAGHLVIPVSVPVTKKDQEKGDEINEITNYLRRNNTEKGKKTRPCPKPLYIPPPVLENNSSSSGCFQSSMRSPESLLSEYLYSGDPLCQFTPPPMLSPIRQGTGLYFNTFCTPSSAKYQPPALDEEDGGKICLVKDLMLYPVQPHINIGDRFQALIPECKDRSLLEGEEEKADLVWRPCLPTVAVSHLLNFACSSAVPRGGCNLELALHCLHFSQCHVLQKLDECQEALDKLLGNEQQKLLPRCLADYHYAGSDHWSGTEKCQFKKAYYKQQKNFSYIQSMIPGKNIYQCVEYYYTWKKILGLKRLSTEQSFDGEETLDRKEPHSGIKIKSKNQKKETEPKEKSLKSQKETRDGEEPKKFACQECERVFDKVKSRNAHMKKHRVQEYNARDFYY